MRLQTQEGQKRPTHIKHRLENAHFIRPVKEMGEFTQQDGGKRRAAKRFCVTKVTGLLLSCFVVVFTKYFLHKDMLHFQ